MPGFQHDIAGGQGNLIITSVQSPNFVAGSSGWVVRRDGSAEFNNLTIRGTFNGTNFIINSSGAFFYSGTPASGNLIASIAPVSGTDSFGNSYKDGFCSYKSGATMQLHVNATNSIPALEMFTGAGSEKTQGSMYSDITNLNAVNETVNTLIQGPQSTFDSANVFLTLVSAAKDGTAGAAGQMFHNVSQKMFWDVLGVHITSTLFGTGGTLTIGDAVSMASGKFITSDTWHSLGTLAGYSVGVGRYRFLPTNQVQLEISVTAGGTNAASVAFQNALPAAYRPLADKRRSLAGSMTNTVWPNVLVSASTGSVTVGQNASNAFGIYGDVTFPLD